MIDILIDCSLKIEQLDGKIIKGYFISTTNNWLQIFPFKGSSLALTSNEFHFFFCLETNQNEVTVIGSLSKLEHNYLTLKWVDLNKTQSSMKHGCYKDVCAKNDLYFDFTNERSVLSIELSPLDESLPPL